MARGKPDPNLSFDFEGLTSPDAKPKPATKPKPAAKSKPASAKSEPTTTKPAPPAEVSEPELELEALVPQEPEVLTVAALARQVQRAFDHTFEGPVLVEGEISGLKAAPSGHVYFTLKDPEAEASLDVVAYRSSVTPKSRALLREGLAVRLRGRLAFYAARGRTQFLVDRILPTGKGALLLAFERLKAKLEAEGLFDPARKRPLPHTPRIVGVVTSKSGAVLHDIHKVAERRGGAHLLVAPATVQGLAAPEELRRALLKLSQVKHVDVIVIARGGGAAEDLAAFNDEALVRAIAECPVPVVSAVGHQTDFTLCDFVADVRAATPSQAAEMVVPDRAAMRATMAERQARLIRAMMAQLDRAKLGLGRLERRIGDPRVALAKARERLDDWHARAGRATQRSLRRAREQLSHREQQLGEQHPHHRLARSREALLAQNARQLRAFERLLQQKKQLFAGRVERLDAMSPLAVLARGYAIALRDGQAVRAAAELAVGDTLQLRLAEGQIEAEVTATHPDAPGRAS